MAVDRRQLAMLNPYPLYHAGSYWRIVLIEHVVDCRIAYAWVVERGPSHGYHDPFSSQNWERIERLFPSRDAALDYIMS